MKFRFVGKKHPIGILSILGCFLFWGSGEPTTTASEPFPETVLSIRREGCYGHCPEYEAHFFANGLVAYVGQANMPRLGRYEAWLDETTLSNLLDQAWKNGLFQMPDQFPPQGPLVQEFPNTTLYLRRGPQEKVIVHNHLGPKDLHAYLSYLEEVMEQLSWRFIPA